MTAVEIISALEPTARGTTSAEKEASPRTPSANFAQDMPQVLRWYQHADIFEDGFAKLGPISSDVEFTDGTLFVSSVTLPTNGKDFRAFVTVSFNASGIFLATGDPISANGSANGYIDSVYIDGAYYPGAFKETPEPGTLALVGTGVLGIVARTKNRFLKFTRG
jgi:hypothetical protein